MHHIYHTEGIILGSRNFGEAGKYYFIFTRDLGMIYASAQGVRKMSSKLRYIMQDFQYVKIDLVQGRDFWRLTSGSKTGELENLVKQKESFKIFSNIARLLRRLLPGTEKNEHLFLDLLEGLKILEQAKSEDELKNIEISLVLKILEHLGYIERNKERKNRLETIALINQILKETHL